MWTLASMADRFTILSERKIAYLHIHENMLITIEVPLTVGRSFNVNSTFALTISQQKNAAVKIRSSHNCIAIEKDSQQTIIFLTDGEVADMESNRLLSVEPKRLTKFRDEV